MLREPLSSSPPGDVLDNVLKDSQLSEGKPGQEGKEKKAFCTRKRWLICGGASVLCLGTVALVAFLAATPIVTTLVNAADMEFLDMGVSDPRPDSFDMYSKIRIKCSSPFPADLAPATVELHYDGGAQAAGRRLKGGADDTLLGLVDLPSMSLQPGRSLVEPMSQSFTLVNQAAFVRFQDSMVHDTTTHLRLKGVVHVKSLGMTFRATLNKVLKLSGMQGLSTGLVTGMDLPSDAPGGGVNVVINASINNPSVASMAIGTVGFNMSYQGYHLGTVAAKNVTLVKGTNVLNLRGVLRPDNLTAASEFMSLYLQGKTTTAESVGVSVEPNIPWVADTVKTMKMTVTVPGYDTSKGALIRSMSTTHMGMNLDPSNQFVNASLSIGMQNPFNFNISVTAMEASLKMSQDSVSPVALTVTQPKSAVTYTPTGPGSGQIGVETVMAPFKIASSDQFGQILKHMVVGKTATIFASGVGTATVMTAMGELTLTGVEVPGLTVLVPAALDGFKHMKSEEVFDIVSADAKGITFNPVILVENPSILSMFVPLMPTEASLGGVDIGNVIASNVALTQGSTSALTTMFNALPDAQTGGRVAEMVSHYISGVDYVLPTRGLPSYPGTLDVLKPSLEAVSTACTITGSSRPTIVHVDMLIADLRLLHVPVTIEVEMEISNFFSQPLSITHIEADIWTRSKATTGPYDLHFAHTPSQDFSKNPIVVPGNTNIKSPKILVDVLIDNCLHASTFFECQESLKALTENIDLKIHSVMTVTVGQGYEMTGLRYNATNVPAKFHFGKGLGANESSDNTTVI